MTAHEASSARENPTSPLTPDEVRKVARLARLELDALTIDRLAIELGSILEDFQRLQALDIDDVEPMAHPLDPRNRLDPDETRPGLANEQFMEMAPESAPPFLKVPRVLPGRTGA